MSVNKNTNGSIMIAALIIALVTGGLVGMFLNTVTQEIKYAHRARMAFQATNLAEAGLETAIHALNHDNWSYWKPGADGYYRDTYSQNSDTWLYVSYSFRGERRHFRVYIEPNPAAKGSTEPPKAVAEGIITLSDGTRISRQVYIQLGNRSLWANGLLAKEYITFNGNNIMIDSYSSSKGLYNTNLNRNDNGTVASVSVFPEIVTAGNADIFGKVATGGDSENPNPPDVGPNGSIRGIGDPDKLVDENRIAYDFEAYLPDPIYPNLSGAITTMPGDKGFGSPGVRTVYSLSALNIKSSDIDSDLTDDGAIDPEYDVDEDAYTIEGDVVLFIDGDININGMLKIKPNSSVKIYLTGDFVIDGNSSSIVNPTSDPTSLIVFGLGKDDPLTTNLDETPQMKLAGNGTFYGAVYAPNYDVVLGGSGKSGEMFGAVVAKTIELGGGYQFHYDEDLAGYESRLAMKVTHWAELTDATERKNMDTILSDGL